MDTFNITVDFEHQFDAESGFRILLNNQMFGDYTYAELPLEITNLNANCIDQYNFTVLDLVYSCCQLEYDFGVVCCDNCYVSNVMVNIDSFYQMEQDYDISFDFDFGTPSNDSFDIQIDDVFISSQSLNSLPFSINSIPCSDETVALKVCITGDSTCCTTRFLTFPCQPDTHITNISYTVIFGDDNTTEIFLNFDQTGPDSCFVTVDYADSLSLEIDDNGNISNYSLGEFPCNSQTPFNINLTNSCSPDITFSIQIPVDSFSCPTVNTNNIYSQNILTYIDSENDLLIIKNDLTEISIHQIEVYNLLGQRLMILENIPTDVSKFDLSNINSQALFIKLTLSNGHIIGEKVIKY